MTGYKTPAQRLEAAHTRIDKLTDEVATLQKVLAARFLFEAQGYLSFTAIE